MSVEIRAADEGRSFADFIDVPYRVQRDNPFWAPPLRVQQKELLSREHPFFADAEIKLYVGYRDGRPVGRIAAINDHKHNRIHRQTTTHFGFFDCEDDDQVAQALFGAVETQARNWRHNIVRGPFNHSVNEEIGLQIDAFDTLNYVMIPGNMPHYAGLVERNGYAKCMDLFCYIVRAEDVNQRLVLSAPKIMERLNISFRKIDRHRIEEETARIWQVYNKAWSKNWFWTPTSREEFDLLVKNLRQIADMDLIFMAEDQSGNLVGFTVAVPNINEALVHNRNGRLFPFGLPALLWRTRPGAIRSARVMVMGVLEEWRGRGIDTVLYYLQYKEGLRKGYEVAEMSQVLETNTMMNRAARLIGGTAYKTHRIYEKTLGAFPE